MTSSVFIYGYERLFLLFTFEMFLNSVYFSALWRTVMDKSWYKFLVYPLQELFVLLTVQDSVAGRLVTLKLTVNVELTSHKQKITNS